MRWMLPLVLVLVIVPSAMAYDEYWAVSAEDGTTMDVVNAANFAASMKGSIAVTFTGKTFEQVANALLTQDVEDTVIVVFDGDDALIMAHEYRFPDVVEASQTYLEGQGFSVDIEEPDISYFIIEDSEEEEPESCLTDERICPDGTSVTRDPENCEVFLPCPEPEPAMQEPDPAPEPSVPEPREPESVEPESEPNVFVRVWHWFAGIFS